MGTSVDTPVSLGAMPGNPLPALTELPNLIEIEKKILYPSEIYIAHDQLRHLLSVVEDDVIYYASRNEIFAISEEKRQLVAWVDFPIQCLAAGFGWVCVGGPNKGLIALQHLGYKHHDFCNSAKIGDQGQQPLGLDSSGRSGSPEGLRYLPHLASVQAAGSPQGPKPIFYKNVGGEIVNAITINKIIPEGTGMDSEVVALFSNNDGTVTVYSLDQMRVLKTLNFGISMNHASIKSDGKLIVACGDTNKAFFVAGRESRPSNDSRWAEFDWVPLAAPDLAGFPQEEYCFSTAFSPDERYCTVSSQSGMLAKYDVALLQPDMAEDEAIVQEYCSSRPGTHLHATAKWGGAIGSVAFSPRPMHLLAWAERKGRVCVADLRNPHRPPQVVELQRDDSDTTEIELPLASSSDLPDVDEPFSRTLQRLGLSQHTEDRTREGTVGSAADHIEDAAQRTRLQEHVRSTVERTISQFEDQPALRDLVRRELEESNDGAAVGSGSGPGTSSANLPPPPRRRSSIVLGRTGNLSSTSSSHPSSLAPILPTTSTLSTSPSRLASSNERNTTSPHPTSQATSSNDIHDAWQTISAAMANAFQDPRRASLQANLRTLRETQESLRRAHRLQRDHIMRQSQDDTASESREHSRLTRTSSPLANEGHSSAPTRRSASVTRIRRSTHMPESSLRSALEDSITESQDRLRMLERDLDQIDREHATFTARASRLWQDSSAPFPDRTGASSGDRSMTAALRSLYGERQDRLERLGNLQRGRADYLTFDGGTPRDVFHLSELSGSQSGDELSIAGMGWSNAARYLYVATTHGIFKLNVHGATHQTFAAAPVPL